MVKISSPEDAHAYDYHRYVPDKRKYRLDHASFPTNMAVDWSRFEGIDIHDPYKYSETIVNSPVFRPLWRKWRANLDAPFYGITNDSKKRNGLYRLQDEGAPTQKMVAAAREVITSLTPKERNEVMRDIDSEDWRQWHNTEMVLSECGLCLETLTGFQIDTIMELLRQSLSEAGFLKVQGAMKTNKFLGEICGREAILNENSYFFSIFGEPSETEPWAYMLFGHHLALNVFVAGQQMTIGPVFIGAEPSIIDSGPDKGLTLCANESLLGLLLMRSLSVSMQQKAQVYARMRDPAMPEGRWNPADQRHLAGAFQDNRVIPYEGVLASDMTEEQQALLMSIATAFLTLWPAKPLQFRLKQIREYLSETYFSWIGGFGPEDPFYYRIQSPVALFEFDHHSGVFLNNEEPAKYHIHTIQRLPNGNDYGRELRRLFLEADREEELECEVWPGTDRGRRATSRYTRKSNEPEVDTADSVTHITESISSNRDSGVDVGFGSAALSAEATTEDANSTFENTLLASPWSQDNLENGHEPQHFDDLLRQLGVSVSSNFWDPGNLSATTPTHSGNSEGPFPEVTNLNVAADLNIQPGVLRIESLNNTSSLAAQTSPSSTSTTNLANGKVSDIESLTRGNDHAASTQRTAPPSVFVHKLAADSYRKAWSMTPDAFASPCETSLQILMLHIVHHLQFGRHGIAWTYCGLAIRIAQSLGLHQRSPPDMGFSKSRISLRSRLWCLILGFDASLSLSQGRSPGLSSGMFEKNMALEYTSTLTDGESSELADYLVWWYQLSLIQIQFCGLMQSKHSIVSRIDGIAQADNRLSAWKESLPPTCRPDSMLLTQDSFRCHALMLHLEYYNFLRAIHLAATVMTTSLDGSTEHSVGYTKANTHILSFHLNNYMAAIAVLYRSIMKDPANMSSRADLEYLRAGKMHLYWDMPANVSGPALKALFDNMLSSAEEMVSKHSIGLGSRR
ncbi:hypothetical protein CkaCkLH20_06868 [Colletotrichum karsti]|uniref:Xylanolytic transcriptional activator regulatory domain-containing protein n=1 Tax=Colletotrichum karsti TaxID=1095194 RepID=A0A9P6I1Z5_9PEZI|nr:uncharacterized protein CkaCkLH20_06868 [Colletotrichum karsti]KAF9875487.1 hypothetical protein CkaCkLH20_06868 [Colletotrichum karsti]